MSVELFDFLSPLQQAAPNVSMPVTESHHPRTQYQPSQQPLRINQTPLINAPAAKQGL